MKQKIIKWYRQKFKPLTLQLKPTCKGQKKNIKKKGSLYSDARLGGVQLIYMLRRGEYFCYYCCENHVDERTKEELKRAGEYGN